jgi:hypothetical protein
MHNKKLPLLSLAFLVATSTTAFAQEADEWTEPAAPAPATTPAAEPEKPAVKAAPAVVVVKSDASACLATNNGLDQASAYTGWQIVCDEIRNQGVTLAPEGASTPSAYRVTFDRLGNQLVLRVSFESPVGHATRTKRMVLTGPEELPVAAPRMAAAIVQDSPLKDSERVDNLVGEETRQYKKKHGEFLWGLGLLGVSAPGASVVASPGLEFMGYYETPQYGFGFSLRSGFGGSGDSDMSYGAISVGGRYFFGESDIAPFAGAGVAASGIEIDRPKDNYHAEGSGFGAFAEVGVEFMRLHSSRLVLGLRADAPFYSVKTGDSYYYDYSTGTSGEQPEKSEYQVPITLSATYAW